MIVQQRFWVTTTVLLVAAVALLPAAARRDAQTVFALAPQEIVAGGLGDLRSVVVDERGEVFVTDVKHGRLLQVTRDGGTTVVLDGLRRPAGAAFDAAGRLVVVESRRRRILRVEPEGEVITLVSGIRRPQWIAAAANGRLYVTAKGFRWRDEDPNDDERGEREMVVMVTPEGNARVFARRLRGLQGLTVEADRLTLLARGRKRERRSMGGLYVVPIELDGRAGTPAQLVLNQFRKPSGLARDRLGAYFVGARGLAGEPRQRRVIAKVAWDGMTTLFAEGLADPRGLAFGPEGSLYVADGRSGRILRFRAPPSPIVEALPDAITRERTVPLRLRADAKSLVTVLGGRSPVVGAVGAGGSAVMAVPLHSNAENLLQAFTTARAGLGLTSLPLLVTVIHDDRPPLADLATPRPGALVRGAMAAEIHAADRNGIAGVEFRLDDAFVGFDAVMPFRVSVDTTTVSDGRRTLSAAVSDRAGNIARRVREITVDNTPPEVAIVAPASGARERGPVEVIVEAADATSPVARVEVTVDGALRFAADTPPYRFRFDPELTSGPYVIAAAAVDQAGNRGESDPVTVSISGVKVRIEEPRESADVSAGSVLVRGHVEATGEVGVTVNGIRAAVRRETFGALTPLVPGTAALTAVAKTAAGATATHTIAVRVSALSTPRILLRATPESGTAPLAVTFSIRRAPRNAVITLDFDGDGTVDVTGPSEGPHTFIYPRPGLFFPTATVADPRGGQLAGRVIVQVYDRTTLDALVRDKWLFSARELHALIERMNEKRKNLREAWRATCFEEFFRVLIGPATSQLRVRSRREGKCPFQVR